MAAASALGSAATGESGGYECPDNACALEKRAEKYIKYSSKTQLLEEKNLLTSR